ncbi:HTH domain-containing protein [Pigmentiphaga sp. GD03639]|uniref:IclR family transcriptional regulator n=1 Tax=Pigmentiphaga sp. GD03639 TaxID=2975354 RepID=UPI002447EC71|nr:IclR family transcriptional regulator C-terminal domain-containing protein [Pigmentiphaga sp. GD03639]MDH2238540.1 HTH domain-containing protein [Pigmentiphaga sp. GD03639]
MSERLLRILGSFDLSRPVRKPAQLMAELGVSRASIYRDLKALEEAGLLERVADRGYALGPLIVELDRQIRLADPLLQASGSLLRKLAAETGGTVLLCRVHGDKVLCIHQEVPADPVAPVSYERGRAMPLYLGATSKVILAHLPRAELERLWHRDRAAIVRAGFPSGLQGFLAALEPLREARACVTHSEVDPGMAGLAVALLDGQRVLGSLSVVVPLARLPAARGKTVLSRLFSVASAIESTLENERLRARSKR